MNCVEVCYQKHIQRDKRKRFIEKVIKKCKGLVKLNLQANGTTCCNRENLQLHELSSSHFEMMDHTGNLSTYRNERLIEDKVI